MDCDLDDVEEVAVLIANAVYILIQTRSSYIQKGKGIKCEQKKK